MNEINLEDCRDTMSRMDDNSVDSIVTDPPYELGFMGKDWDNTGIAYDVDMWAECLRVLKPGGYLMAFSATRTYHRMAVAIEDAGFEIRDMIEWVYGSGFPKSLNIGKAVDKLQGNEREEYIHKYASRRVSEINSNASHEYGFDTTKKTDTKGTSEWEGWGTALKPAHEPICMARKPLSEKTVAENVLKWGTGGINIDESRVEANGEKTGGDGYIGLQQSKGWNANNMPYKREQEQSTTQGRFPANLIHDNSEEVRECFPESKGEEKRTQIKAIKGRGKLETCYGDYGDALHNTPSYQGGGNASRFFKSIIYQAKASKSERNKGCEGLPLGEPPASARSKPAEGRKSALGKPRTNNHPTVKPIALIEYLIKMVTKPNGIVYDPFGGSGTTACACILNGYSYILSEMEVNHVEIIKARTDHYKQQHTQATLF